MNLPGIGYVQLNQQTRASDGTEHLTHMLVVRVTRNVPRLPSDGRDPSSSSVAALTAVERTAGFLGGYAFGSQAVASGVPLGANAGRSALALRQLPRHGR